MIKHFTPFENDDWMFEPGKRRSCCTCDYKKKGVCTHKKATWVKLKNENYCPYREETK